MKVVNISTIVISFVRALVTVSKLNKQTMTTNMTITSHQRLASVMKEFWSPLSSEKTLGHWLFYRKYQDSNTHANVWSNFQFVRNCGYCQRHYLPRVDNWPVFLC